MIRSVRILGGGRVFRGFVLGADVFGGFTLLVSADVGAVVVGRFLVAPRQFLTLIDIIGQFVAEHDRDGLEEAGGVLVAGATGAAVDQANDDVAVVGIFAFQDVCKVGELTAEKLLAERIVAAGLKLNIL